MSADPKILVSASVTYGEDAFSTLGQVRVKTGRSLSREEVSDLDMLVIRSTCPVRADVVSGSQLRFVGTATIGIDHMDTDAFDAQGIRWTHAPGCNAVSVMEYMASALLCLSVEHGVTLEGRVLGVIGVGQVGSRIARLGQALGMQVLLHDPPKANAGVPAAEASGLPDATYCDRDTVLDAADIVTVHVPLTQQGPYATVAMVDDDFLRRMKRGAVFINAARGPVVDSNALLDALARDHLGHAVIDTWDGEPDWRTDLMRHVRLASPHIAGYGFDGKVRGTEMVYADACRFLGVAPCWTPDALLPEPLVPRIRVDTPPATRDAFLWHVIQQTYDIRNDDVRMRDAAHGTEQARREAFDRMRKEYPVRREFRFTEVTAPSINSEWRAALTGLGFRLAD